MPPTRSTSILIDLANRRLLAVFGLAWLALMGLLFAWTGRFSLTAVATACGHEAPDVLFAPDPGQIEAFLAGCGAPGLQAYQDLQVIDLFYPAATAAFLTVALAFLLRDASPRLAWLAALPAAAALGDYAENAAAWVLISTEPSTLPWAAATAMQAGSAVKFILSWVSWLALATLLIGRIPTLYDRITGRHQPEASAHADQPAAAGSTPEAGQGDVRHDRHVLLGQDEVTIR